MSLKNYQLFLFSAFLTLIVTVLWTPQSGAQSGLDEDSKKEFKQKLEDLNQRYEDFFVHFQEKKRRKYERELESDEKTKEREEWNKKKLEARKKFVRVQPDRATEEKFLKKQEEINKMRENSRQLYVKRRDELQKIKDTARTIPQDKEVGFED